MLTIHDAGIIANFTNADRSTITCPSAGVSMTFNESAHTLTFRNCFTGEVLRTITYLEHFDTARLSGHAYTVWDDLDNAPHELDALDQLFDCSAQFAR